MPADPVAAHPPATLLAWSEWFLEQPGLDDSPPATALWRPEGEAVAIGLAQSPEAELYVDALREDGLDLVRRQSGGGAVVLYEGVLCWEAWSTTAAMGGGDQAGIRAAYGFLTRPVTTALESLGLAVFQAGVSDISLPWRDGGARKLAGTAQLRRKDRVLVHGSLLVSPDLERLGRYLRFPSQEPEYRRGRSHRDFCLSVAEALGDDGEKSVEKLIDRVSGAIATVVRDMGWRRIMPPEELPEGARRLAGEKYRNDDWNWERRRGQGRGDVSPSVD